MFQCDCPPEDCAGRVQAYLAGDREYPLKHVKYGEILHPIQLTGITRITKATAQDFDFLLTGKVPRRLTPLAPGP